MAKKAKQLAEHYQNKELIAAVKQNGSSPIIVATLGFNFIVNPILNSLQINCDRLVGCRFWQGARDRCEGKLLMLKKFYRCKKLNLRSSLLTLMKICLYCKK